MTNKYSLDLRIKYEIKEIHAADFCKLIPKTQYVVLAAAVSRIRDLPQGFTKRSVLRFICTSVCACADMDVTDDFSPYRADGKLVSVNYQNLVK